MVLMVGQRPRTSLPVADPARPGWAFAGIGYAFFRHPGYNPRRAQLQMTSVLPDDTFSAFFLAGGWSRRMGRNKALLEFSGRPLLAHLIEMVRPLVGRVAIAGSPEAYRHLGVEVLPDPVAGRGPVAGICAALSASSTNWNLILACDLPYLTADFLRHLIRTAKPSAAQVVVPAPGDAYQPLAAAYHRDTLPVYESLLVSGYPKITEAYRELRLRILTAEELKPFDFGGRLFKNMNSAREYEEARAWWEGRP